MALKEYVEVKPITQKKVENLRRLFLEVFLVFIQTIIPFAAGYYLCKTGNLVYLIVVLIVMAFNVTIKERQN